jgi:hypothetical protein
LLKILVTYVLLCFPQLKAKENLLFEDEFKGMALKELWGQGQNGKFERAARNKSLCSNPFQ